MHMLIGYNTLLIEDVIGFVKFGKYNETDLKE